MTGRVVLETAVTGVGTCALTRRGSLLDQLGDRCGLFSKLLSQRV
jgi:hypothetical protein